MQSEARRDRVAHRLHRSAERLLLAALLTIGLMACEHLEASDQTPVPTGSQGETFVVAPWGSDDGAGSEDDPFATLRPAADLVMPGDIVLLRGGVYDDLSQVYYSVTMSGTEEAPVTIRSYPGETAVLDGIQHAWHPRSDGDGHPVNDPMLLQVFGDHLVFEDLTFRNSVGNGFYFVGYHNVVRRVTSHGHHGHGVQFQGSNNLLEHVTSFDNDSVANGGNSADGISMTDGAHIRTIKGDGAESRGNVVRYSLTYRNSDDGIDTWNAWETLLEYNVSFENGIGPTGNGSGFKLGGDQREDIGTIARFNISFKNTTNFNTNTSTGVTLVNNTSWSVRDAGIGYALTTYTTDADENFAYNNVSFDDRWPRARGEQTDDRNNSWNLNMDDPGFASLDIESPDFLALRPDGAAANAGMDVGLAFTDAAPDLGALQVGDHLTIAPTQAATWGRIEWRRTDTELATRRP